MSSRVKKDEAQTFIQHLYELRSRLFWVVASLVVTSAIGFQYKDFLVNFVIAPLHGEKLVYLTPGGGFSFIFTICLYFGALVTIPVVMYHIYRFLQPVLGKTSRRFVALIILLSSTLAASGAVFGYYVAIPAAIQFLSTFAGDAVMPNLTAESYLSFIVAYMLGLAALFQLPLLLFIIDHVRPFPPGALMTSQRFVIAGSVIAAALITPTPDIVNQLIVAGPIIAIYQLGAFAVFARRKLGRRVAKASSVQTTDSNESHERQLDARQPQAIPTKSSAAPTVSLASQVALPVVAKKPPTLTVHRSLDGFSKSRPVATQRQSLSVPSRGMVRPGMDIRASLQKTTAPTPNTNVHTQTRSLDGLSML